MKHILTILHITLHEAGRRRVLTATLIGAGAFLLLYGIGFYFVAANVHKEAGASVVRQRLLLNFLTLAGLYATNFLTVMTSVLLPVDTLSGDIASGVVQTVASKPVRRSSIVLGKWLAFSLVAVAYYLVVAGGVLLIARIIGHFTPPGLAIGMPLMALEAVVLVSLSIGGGARLSTVTNGVMVFGLYGLAFIGGWVEQIATVVRNDAVRYVGTAISLVSPADAMYRRAAHELQPSGALVFQLPLFTPLSVPSGAMIVWALAFVVVTLLFAIRTFRHRPL